MNCIGFIDIAGGEILVQEAQRLRAMGGGLYFCKNKKAVMEFLNKSHIIDEIGAENFFTEKKDAIAAIYAKLDRDKCASCRARIFYECQQDQSLPAPDQAKSAGMSA